MRVLLLYIVAACLVLRALQLAVAGLVVALAIAFVIGFVTRPRETLGMVIASAGWMLLERYPAQTLGGIAALSALSWIELWLKRRVTAARNGSCPDPQRAIEHQSVSFPES